MEETIALMNASMYEREQRDQRATVAREYNEWYANEMQRRYRWVYSQYGLSHFLQLPLSPPSPLSTAESIKMAATYHIPEKTPENSDDETIDYRSSHVPEQTPENSDDDETTDYRSSHIPEQTPENSDDEAIDYQYHSSHAASAYVAYLKASDDNTFGYAEEDDFGWDTVDPNAAPHAALPNPTPLPSPSPTPPVVPAQQIPPAAPRSHATGRGAKARRAARRQSLAQERASAPAAPSNY